MSKDWWKKSAEGIPSMKTEIPGPESTRMHKSTSRYFHGLSGQVKLMPLAFSEGYGITMTDADGNKYLDFSSGIYVTSLGHCHPKVSEAVAHWAKKLMNAHDFANPVKEKLVEKLADVLPGNLNAMQFYSDGTAAVEAGIRAARAISGKHEFISAFPEGYATTIGERGVTLSGGQRQRIAIARAFLTNPRILILDDSTSAIDSATEDQIQRAMKRISKERTTFIITHRLSQIRWANRILVLRKGELVDQGSHEELMARSPDYSRIFARYE